MKNTIRKGLGVFTAIGLVAATAVTASATSVSGFAGQPQNPGQYDCFTNAGGNVTNQCSGTLQYCVALPSTQTGHDVKVSVTAPSTADDISCFASSAYNTGYPASSSWPPRFPTVIGQPFQIDLGSVTVPDQGGLWTCCNMAQGSTLNSIQF